MYAFTCQDAYKSLDCKHSPDSLIEPEPNHKAGGATGTEVHLQTAEKPQRRGELSTTDISYWVLLISHARHKHKRISTSVLPDKGHGGSAGGPTTGMAERFLLTSEWLVTHQVGMANNHISAVCQQTVHSCSTWRWSLVQTDWVMRAGAAVICRDGKLQTNVKGLLIVQHFIYKRKLRQDSDTSLDCN